MGYSWGNVSSESSQAKGRAEEGVKNASSILSDVNNAVAKNNATTLNYANGYTNLIDKNIDNINKQAETISATTAMLTPYIERQAVHGDELYDLGRSLIGQGNSVLGNASDLMALNANASGLVGDYIKNLQSIDPDKYVSSAASDVQSSFDNARGQYDRSLSRQGLSASSGRSQALNQQFAIALATALAGAKTKARQTGVSEQSTAYRNALSDAMSITQQGSQFIQSAVQASSAANESYKGAMSAANTIGDLQKTVSDLMVSAGGLRSKQADLMLSISDNIQKGIGMVISASGNYQQAVDASARTFVAVGEMINHSFHTFTR